MSRKDEYSLQVTATDHLRWQYPDIIFRSDLAGIKLTPGQATKIKRIQKSRGYPDLFIAAARRGYHGFFPELKVDENEYLTKKGTIRESKHIQEQYAVILQLREAGYWADFVPGIDKFIELVDWYLNDN